MESLAIWARWRSEVVLTWGFIDMSTFPMDKIENCGVFLYIPHAKNFMTVVNRDSRFQVELTSIEWMRYD